MTGKMTVVGSVQGMGTGVPMLDAMMPFVEWSVTQGPEVHLRVLAYVVAIEEVLSDVRMVSVVRGFALPDCWAMELAATGLRDMAASADFPEAAAFCEEARREACALIAMATELYREAQGFQ